MSPDVLPEDEASSPIQIESLPPRLSQGVAIGTAIVGTLLTVPFATLALPFGLSGLLLIGVALMVRHARSWLTAGTAMLLVGATISGAYGAVSPEVMLLGVGLIVLGWDVGQHGITLGHQLGRNSPANRNQLVHIGMTAVVLSMVSIVSYGVYLVASGDQQVTTVVLLLVGVLVVAWVFRR